MITGQISEMSPFLIGLPRIQVQEKITCNPDFTPPIRIQNLIEFSGDRRLIAARHSQIRNGNFQSFQRLLKLSPLLRKRLIQYFKGMSIIEKLEFFQ